MFGSLVDYWYYTGDTTYNQVTSDALLYQVGPYNDYMPPNQTLTEGNDDQGFWGMAAMSAAEYKFPDPPHGKPQWLALAQAVFNTQAARWDPDQCNGGLRWQIFRWNNGFNYKNSISQGCFFNVAARLALYTGNSTYADWAVKTWDWMVDVKFMDASYRVFDGAHIEDSCTDVVPYQFSYNVGTFLHGAAAMYAYADSTGQSGDRDMWRERVDGLLNGTDVFFFSDENGSPPVMIEIACEGVGLCNLDQQSFKAYLSRWMAATTKWAPWTYDKIKPLLANSAQAAAQQCTGGENGRMCGLKWANNSGQWDGTSGVGQQMAAMEIVLANMIHESERPVTNTSGGTSTGDPTGGGSDIGRTDPQGSILFATLTTGDRVGAVVCTVIICGAILTAVLFMTTDETKSTGENWEDFTSSWAKGAGPAVLVEGGKYGNVNEKGNEIWRSDSDNSRRVPLQAPAGSVVRQPQPTASYRPRPIIITDMPESSIFTARTTPVPGRRQRKSLQKRDRRPSAT